MLFLMLHLVQICASTMTYTVVTTATQTESRGGTRCDRGKQRTGLYETPFSACYGSFSDEVKAFSVSFN